MLFWSSQTFNKQNKYNQCKLFRIKRNYFFLFFVFGIFLATKQIKEDAKKKENENWVEKNRKSIPGNCASGLKKVWWWCCDWKPNGCWKMKAWSCLLRDPRLICWSSRVEGGGGPWQSPGSILARGLCSFLL